MKYREMFLIFLIFALEGIIPLLLFAFLFAFAIGLSYLIEHF